MDTKVINPRTHCAAYRYVEWDGASVLRHQRFFFFFSGRILTVDPLSICSPSKTGKANNYSAPFRNPTDSSTILTRRLDRPRLLETTIIGTWPGSGQFTECHLDVHVKNTCFRSMVLTCMVWVGWIDGYQVTVLVKGPCGRKATTTPHLYRLVFKGPFC